MDFSGFTDLSSSDKRCNDAMLTVTHLAERRRFDFHRAVEGYVTTRRYLEKVIKLINMFQ